MNATSSELALRHLGLITKFAIQYWRKLPNQVKVHYDLEDMVNDVVLHVHTQRRFFNKEFAKESTWVGSIARNYCLNIVNHYYYSKYVAIEPGELTPELHNKIAAVPRTEQLQSAHDAVRRVIEGGSDEVNEFIEKLFKKEIRRSSIHIPRSVIEDFLRTAARCRANYHDFELLLRYANTPI